MKVLFLDVDGVLIHGRPPTNWKTPEPKAIAALNKLLAAEPDLMIVVSSCWRTGRTRIELCDLLNEWGVTPGRVLDRTGGFLESRGEEIQEWLGARLERRDDVTKFVIIDDDSDMGSMLPKLVKTASDTGLTDADVALALEILRSGPATAERMTRVGETVAAVEATVSGTSRLTDQTTCAK